MKLFPKARNQVQEKFSIRKAPENQEADGRQNIQKVLNCQAVIF